MMDLGKFSISLTVKDIHASKKFYEILGFTQTNGNVDQNWLVMKNGLNTVGLFQGMFEHNILTFNPGWDASGNPLESFEDVRSIRKRLKLAGLSLDAAVENSPTGPAHFSLLDPDGNAILIDQHV